MDEFGVLTERYGLKPQGKSAPMAELKRPDGIGSDRGRSSGQNRASADQSSSYATASSWNSSSGSKAFVDDYSEFLQSNSGSKGQGFGSLDDFGDLFGGSRKPSKPPASNSGVDDYDSLFNSSARSSSTYDNDDIFGGMPGVKSSASVGGAGVFGSFASPPRQSSPVDDLLGGYQNDDHDDIFGGIGTKSRKTDSNGSEAGHGAAESDDLIPGFGGSSPPADNQRRQSQKTNVYSAESSSNLSEDPFVVLESTSKPVHASSEMFSDPLEESSQFGNFQRANEVGDKVKSPSVSSLDELENFAMGQAQGNTDTQSDFLSVGKRSGAEKKARGPGVSSIDELEDYFMDRVQRNADIQSDFLSGGKSSGPEKKAGGYCKRGPYENKHKVADDLESFFSAGLRSSSVPKSRPTSSTKSKEVPKTPPKPTFEVRSSMKKASSATNFMDDFSLMFGAASFAGEFEEIEGESEERRRARLGRHERTQERVAKAVAEMNQRDSQTLQEQEERHRIAENLDMEIKRWAAGKEGNMRALLSSLQQVLWPESGWEPVSLTDLITSTSVKQVYRKATLRVHPDKVQQKGASIQQKYTAEKVFDILKEAWKKFEAEELR
ncbi:auxilin-related protein 2 isoform X2 [Rhodamnia argentea]|uniref:Auxilin-related protein 2 isoform X2 n=1 Tax=Rhodamnia argentea TaxID=178133 RepID=A0A8B8QF41_9MYRT|nr:auxilin-related protein 2 isoform X2 [Rhodamnia argentea]